MSSLQPLITDISHLLRQTEEKNKLQWDNKSINKQQLKKQSTSQIPGVTERWAFVVDFSLRMTFLLSKAEINASSLLNGHDVMQGEKLTPPTKPVLKNLSAHHFGRSPDIIWTLRLFDKSIWLQRFNTGVTLLHTRLLMDCSGWSSSFLFFVAL